MKRLTKVLLCLVLAVALVYTPVYLPVLENTPAVATVEAATVKISKKSATVNVGATLKLKISGTKKKVTWSTSNKSVAIVSSKGVVTGKKAGKATITAKVGGKKYTCKVTVKEAPKLNKKSASVYIGATTTLKVTGTSKKVTWSSSSSSVASVSSKGKVTAKKAGTATITAKVGTKKLTCKVTVKKRLKTSTTSLKLETGDKGFVTITYYGTGSTYCESSNYDVAYGEWATKWNGDTCKLYIYGEKAGTATLTVTNSSNKEAVKIKVTVKQGYVEVDSVSINKSSLSMKVGETSALTATVRPTNATSKTVEWYSDDESVATVDAKGNVTAVGAGSTKIWACAGYESDYCNVTVKAPEVESVELDKTKLTLGVGEESRLTATINPFNADDQTAEWKTSDKKVVTVDENGNLKAISAGSAKITATAGYKSATCTVTVLAPTFKMGETWTVDDQWRFQINSVETHYKCNKYETDPGVQVVTIDYTYWCDGTPFYSGGLNFGFTDFEVYDEDGEVANHYTCTHNTSAKYISVGKKCNAQVSFLLTNESDSITVDVEKPDVDFISQKASFELDFGNSSVEPDEPKDDTDEPVTPSVVQNKTALKQYIQNYGSTNTSGNKFIKKTTSGSTDTTAGIVYQSSKNNFSFISTVLTADTEATVSMELGMGEGGSVEPTLIFMYDDMGVGFKSYVTLDPADYDGHEDVYFTVDSSYGAVTNSDIQGLSNSLMKLGFASWENLLVTQAGMSLTDLGFTSYEL